MNRLTQFAAIAMLAAAQHAAAQAAPDATYQGLGGKDGIARIVRSLIPLIQADARIKDTFTDTDMAQLASRLAEQLCELAGGPCRYTGKYKGKDMESVHVDLKVSYAQFNALTEDLQIAMERNAVPARFQNQLVAKLAPMARVIVTR